MTMRRPRGRRKLPPARLRAVVDPYGGAHRKVRALLLAALASMGSAPCPLCGKAMTVAMPLHLHHSDPAAALRGLPGDQLTHARCNVADGGRLGASITNARATATTAKAVTKPRW
jgi:hypothetical protein